MCSDAEVSTLVGGRAADEHALLLPSTTSSVSSVELDTLDLFRFCLPQLFLLLLLDFLFDGTVCSGAFWLTTVVASVDGCMSHKAVVPISCEEDMLPERGTSSEDSLAGEGVSSEDSLDNSCEDSLAGEGISSEDSLNSCEDSLAGEGINCDAWLTGEGEDKLAGVDIGCEGVSSEGSLAGVDIGCEGVRSEGSLAGVAMGCEGVSNEDVLADGTCEISWHCGLFNLEMVCEHASDLLTETCNSEPLSKSNKALWKEKVASPFGC